MIVVDRVMDGLAVCEVDGSATINIPLSRISGPVREGALLTLTKDAGPDSLYAVDDAATQRRKAAISERFNRLKARRKPGR